jgi:hypothetical protein
MRAVQESIILWCAAPFLDGFAEVGRQLFDAPAGAAVPFDHTVPATLGGVTSEGLLDLTSGPQPWGVVGCGDQLGAGQVEVALARPLGRQA